MSQKKLYFSRVGGEPFGGWRKLAPWGDWHRAHGQTEAAKLRGEQLKTTCSDTGQTFTPIGD